MTANVIQGAYVQDTYWLLVQAPDAAAGATAGTFYDLTVALGTPSATQPSSLLYVNRDTDTAIVLDRSGSMAGGDKIGAARNAANVLTNQLAPADQGDYISFDHNSTLRVPMAPMTGTQRSAMETAIAGETPGGATSIGDGMRSAVNDLAAHRDPVHACGIVLLSDGYENDPELWASVRADVQAAGCPVHSIACLGPSANEPLMQQIGASVPGGSYDYAAQSGVVPVGSSGSGAGASGGAGGSPGGDPPPSTGPTTWPASTTPRPPNWPGASAWPRWPASARRAAGRSTPRWASRASCPARPPRPVGRSATTASRAR